MNENEMTAQDWNWLAAQGLCPSDCRSAIIRLQRASLAVEELDDNAERVTRHRREVEMAQFHFPGVRRKFAAQMGWAVTPENQSRINRIYNTATA